jgi:hypothetical protein
LKTVWAKIKYLQIPSHLKSRISEYRDLAFCLRIPTEVEIFLPEGDPIAIWRSQPKRTYGHVWYGKLLTAPHVNFEFPSSAASHSSE